MTKATVTLHQRIEMMKLLPATVAQIADKLGMDKGAVRKRLAVLAEQQAAQVIGGGGHTAKLWGYYTGVPYVPPAKRKVTVPVTPYKTIWVGGNPYAKK